ncbi:MAG: hypothetical protein VCE43_20210 [Myxococcota bacterium]
MQNTIRTKKIYRRYWLELGAAMAGYGVVLVGSIVALRHLDDSPWRFAVAIAPVLPLGIAAWAIFRALQRIDELHLRVQLNALALAFGASALTSICVGFLQIGGLPDLSWIWVWPMMGAYWCLGVLISVRRFS